MQSLNYKFFQLQLQVWNLPNGTSVKWGRPSFPSGSGFKRNQTPDQQLLPHSHKPLRHVVAQLHAVVYGFCASSGMYSRNVSVRWVHVCFTKLGLSRLLSFVYHSDNSYIFLCLFFFFSAIMQWTGRQCYISGKWGWQSGHQAGKNPHSRFYFPLIYRCLLIGRRINTTKM